jgi:hypothetical protein
MLFAKICMMMKSLSLRSRPFFSITLVFLLNYSLGCASAPVAPLNSLPEWVQAPEKSYPSDRYLVSVGSGTSREQAIQEAKKAMAESFVVKVQSVTESKSGSTLKQDTEGQSAGESSQDIQQKVTLHTDTWLRGAEVKESVQEGDSFYALVALDRLKARSGLLLESNRIKSQLETVMESLEGRFNQAKLNQAKALFLQFESLYGEASALGMSSLVDVNALESRLNRVVEKNNGKNRKIPFAVKTVQGETYFERDIEACINDRGGTLYEKNDQANRVEISVIERAQHMSLNGWERIRFDLTASIVQLNGQKYRIQTTQTETGRNRNAILETVSDKLSADLCDQLFSRISEMNVDSVDAEKK